MIKITYRQTNKRLEKNDCRCNTETRETLPINLVTYQDLLNKIWRIKTMPKRSFTKDDIRKFAERKT